MVNSDVPHYSNRVSELPRNYLFKSVKILSSTRSNGHTMAPLCERIKLYKAIMVKSHI